jgi:hypothetical protein
LGFESIEAHLTKRNPAPATLEAIQRNSFPIRTPDSRVIRDSAFILMNMDPEDPGLADVHQTIRAVCADFGIDASRIDDVQHQDRITDRILEMIETAEFIIADLSGEKPNVYYEVGYAHALGKRPILVRKAGTRLHFDLVVHNVPEYKNITMLSDMLRRRFEAILGRSAKSSSAT